MPTILIVGAADTGRAPIAAALLRRLLEVRGYDWSVESAGVLGHDGAAAETEARDTMVHLGLDIADHRARSIDEALAEQAALLIALDAGTVRVIRARFPAASARAFSLGELAGRPRDIPDPFRMQIGAWMTYAREIAGMLEVALQRIVELMPVTDDRRPTTGHPALSGNSSVSGASAAGETKQKEPAPHISSERAAAAMRIAQLLQIAAQMPDVVDWGAARPRIEADLATIAAAPVAPGDLVVAYAGLLRAALGLLPAAPSANQLAALRDAAAGLGAPIDQDALNDLSARIATLPTLS